VVHGLSASSAPANPVGEVAPGHGAGPRRGWVYILPGHAGLENARIYVAEEEDFVDRLVVFDGRLERTRVHSGSWCSLDDWPDTAPTDSHGWQAELLKTSRCPALGFGAGTCELGRFSFSKEESMIKPLAFLLLGVLAGTTQAQAKGGKAAKSPAGPRISSSYVNLQKCENLWEAPANAPEGSDEPVECAAPGGYRAGEQYSAATTWHVVSHPQAGLDISLVPKAGTAWSATPVMEFRLCDGRPFAVIQRVEVRDDEDNCGDKCVHKVLIVEGLVGLEGRHAEIPAGPKANVQARQTADGWVAESGCPAPPRPSKKR